MILWTVQPATAVEDINKYGSFRCVAEKSYNLSKSNSLKPQYSWLIEKMKKRIGDPPSGVTYPIWAWHTWEYERRQPDTDSAAFVERDYDTVCFVLDVPDNEVVLTDFDAWQIVMNGWYLSYEQNEEKLDALLERLESLSDDEQLEMIKASWENVFLIDELRSENFSRGEYIQATFWEIKKEYVKEIIKL